MAGVVPVDSPNLFRNDLAYARNGLEEMNQKVA